MQLRAHHPFLDVPSVLVLLKKINGFFATEAKDSLALSVHRVWFPIPMTQDITFFTSVAWILANRHTTSIKPTCFLQCERRGENQVRRFSPGGVRGWVLEPSPAL